MQTQLADKWVLITGASSGFGAAGAVAFGKKQVNLILGARRVDRLASVAAKAKHVGASSAHFQSLDVSKTSSVEEFVNWLRGLTQRIDVLVNNAGGAHGMDPVAESKDEDWEAMVQSNLLGLLRVTRAVLPLMTPYPGGSIINIGSVAGHTAYEGGAAYCACKAGELQVTRSLRLELCGSGLRVGTIDLGLADTEFSEVRFKGDVERARKVYQGMHPLTANDVAEAMVWMASQPSHVCIDEMIIKPTDQAAVYKVHRRTSS